METASLIKVYSGQKNHGACHGKEINLINGLNLRILLLKLSQI